MKMLRVTCNSRELEKVYSDPNIINIMKPSTLRWAGHVVRMEDNELPTELLRTNPGVQRGRDRPKSRWIDGLE